MYLLNSLDKNLITALLVTGLSACASLPQPQATHLQSADSETQHCAELLQALDHAVTSAGVKDIGARRINGFPYLRINRFLASFSQQTAKDVVLHDAWFEQLRNQDVLGRRIELANLPASGFTQAGFNDALSLAPEVEACSRHLSLLDSQDESRMELLRQQARVEDDYSTTKRILGLYALTRYPFYWGVKDWQQDTINAFQAAQNGARSDQPLQVYLPPFAESLSRQQVRAILARMDRHPLGMIELSDDERQQLFATFAPVFEVETAGDYDRIGTVQWSTVNTPQVDTSQATVYTRIEYTRHGTRTLLQLVYVAWFPERPRKHAFDLLGGHLDGITWRVTLAPDGEPVVFDSIHPCGCYHMFFPTPRMRKIASPQENLEWAFVPVELPRLQDNQRLTLGVQTRTHYLHKVNPRLPASGITYRFADYDELRSLPTASGTRRSLFAADGLVAGSERRERFLFWPMGIRSAGAMRQAGSQATAFVGRRHFDDADLIAKRFELLD